MGQRYNNIGPMYRVCLIGLIEITYDSSIIYILNLIAF